MGLHQRLRAEAEQWAGDALMPLMQHTLEHKQMLETHMLRLKALAQETQQARQRGQQLAGYLATLETQLAQASEMLRGAAPPGADPAPGQGGQPANGGPFTGRRRQRLKASGFRHLTTAPALAAGGRAL